MKRNLCSLCNTALVPGFSASIRVKRAKTWLLCRKAYAKLFFPVGSTCHGHRMLYSCLHCKATKSVPAPVTVDIEVDNQFSGHWDRQKRKAAAGHLPFFQRPKGMLFSSVMNRGCGYPTASYDGLPLGDTNYQEDSLYLRIHYFPCPDSSVSSCSFWRALQWLLEMTSLLNLYCRPKTLPSLRLGLCRHYVVLLVSTTTSLWTGNITCDPDRQRRMEIMDIFRVEHIDPNTLWRFGFFQHFNISNSDNTLFLIIHTVLPPATLYQSSLHGVNNLACT